MENIFSAEEQVIREAEKLLEAGAMDTEQDQARYAALLEEYKQLLKQFMMLIKISDLNQSELNALSKRLEFASNIDYLTGLYNRRYFNEVYEKEWLSAVRSQSELAMIMIDIDYFKKYNDVYGHLQGDSCLKAVSKAIRESVQRPRDIVARFGGEEFVILLPETDVKGAERIAGKIFSNIEALGIANAGSPISGKVTVSMGIASIFPKGEKPSSKLLNMSDMALYRAKTEGRCCCRVHCMDILG